MHRPTRFYQSRRSEANTDGSGEGIAHSHCFAMGTLSTRNGFATLTLAKPAIVSDHGVLIFRNYTKIKTGINPV